MSKKIVSTLIAGSLLLVMSIASFASEKATKEEVLTKVQKAIELYKNEGLDAVFKEINNPQGQFVWKDTYVFALDSETGNVLAHPIKPKLIGKNLLHIKDVNGKLFFVEFSQVGKSESGKGWVDYMWPKPGEQTPSPKHSYMERVKNENVMFGAGYYD